MRPTEAGARYLEHCQAIVSIAEEANAGVRNAQVEPTGLLRVASTVSTEQQALEFSRSR